MQGPELLNALYAQDEELQRAQLMAVQAFERQRDAEDESFALMIQAGIEAAEILKSKELRPDTVVWSDEKRGLFGHVKIPSILELKGWELSCSTNNNPIDSNVPVVETKRIILGEDGRFYKYWRLDSLKVAPRFKRLQSLQPIERFDYSTARETAKGLNNLLEQAKTHT
jgi:hypothetical protein